jgi:hypothetical protein
MENTMERTMECYGVLWSAMESTIAYYGHTMGALWRIL